MFSVAFRRSLMARAPMQGYGNGITPRDRLIKKMKKWQGKKGMLKDPAVYPLMAIGTALTLATGFMVYFSLKNEDVRLNRKKRQQLMREVEKQDKVAALDDPFGKA